MPGVVRVVIVFLAVVSTRAFAEDPLPTAKDLALRLREYQSSIKSLRVRYRTRQLPKAGRDGEIEWPGRPYREMLWVKDGRKEYLGELPEAGAPEDAARFIASYDGRLGYEAIYFQIDQEALRSIVIGRERPGGLRVPFPRLLGWSIPIVNETLVSLLERPGEKPISWSDRFEARSVQCDLGYLSEGLGSEHVVKAWFDPEQGWLPRFILILPRAIDEAALAGEPIPAPISPFVFSAPPVDEFIVGRDALAGVERVFPGLCSGTNAENDTREQTIEVHHVEFNSSIDQAVFKPDTPPGTEIIRNLHTPEETREIIGTAADVAFFQELVQADEYPGKKTDVPSQLTATANAPRSVSARPADAADSFFGSPLSWVCLAVVLALSAGICRRFT